MTRKPLQYTYHLSWRIEGGGECVFHLSLDPDTLESLAPMPVHPPDWTRLDVSQCNHCPLRKEDTPYCPAALSLVELIEKTCHVVSHSCVSLTAICPQRTVFAETTSQKALSSLVGLCLAVSGCPVLAKFKPMARFHLPLASREEIIFRAGGMYLLAQYFKRGRTDEGELGLSGLSRIYDQIHAVNIGLAGRLRGLGEGDASLNALTLLDLHAHDLPYVIRERLTEIEGFFHALLDEDHHTGYDGTE